MITERGRFWSKGNEEGGKRYERKSFENACPYSFVP